MGEVQEKAKDERRIQLFPSQEQAKQKLLASLGNESCFFILCGLSGTGKSTVVRSAADEIERLGGVIVEPESITKDKLANTEGARHIVTTALPRELHRIKPHIKKRFPGHDMSVSFLLGLTKQEIIKIVNSLPETESASLTKPEITELSMGIPLLAEKLTLQDLDKSAAVKVAAGYLTTASGYLIDPNWLGPRAGQPGKWTRKAKRYLENVGRNLLRMPIPKEVQAAFVDAVTDYQPSSLYDCLHQSLQARKEIAREFGAQEESPLFVAPESLQIYDQMLQSNDRPAIDIIVPNLFPSDLKSLHQAFGYAQDGEYQRPRARRAKMFPDLRFRKVEFWHRNPDGTEHEFTMSRGAAEEIDRAKALLADFEKGKLPIAPIRNRASFIAHAHDHSNMPLNPALFGWALESLLQQRGIPYFAISETLESPYFFDPEKGHIEIIS